MRTYDLFWAVALSLTLTLVAAVEPCSAEAKRLRPTSPAAAARNDAWTIVGPGGGGTMYIPTISPHDSNRVLTRCDMTGSYISNDAGKSWRMFNLRSTSRFFVFDPVDPDTIYAKSIGLYRSTDAGVSWRLIHPRPENVSGLIMKGDHAGEMFLLKEGPRKNLDALAVDPSDSKTLYATFTVGPWRAASSYTLAVSTDAGETWKDLAELPSRGRGIWADASSAADSRRLYIACGESVSVWEDSALRNHPVAPGGSFRSITAGFDKDTKKIVFYAVTRAKAAGDGLVGGLLVSRDGGASWDNVTEKLTGSIDAENLPRLGAVAASLNHGATAYLTCWRMQTEDGRFRGVARTDDAGATWRLLVDESYKPAPEYEGMAWYYTLYDHGWKVVPRQLGVAPNDPEICYGTDTGRTVKTTDGGKTWVDCFAVRNDDGSVTTTGLDVTTCYGVHFDPFDVNRLFISYTDIGLFRSEDGGTNWLISTEDVPRSWRNTTYWVEFDPEVPGRMWGVFARNHDLPRPKMWRRGDPADYQGGVATSTDGGRSWRAATEGIGETACTHIIMDPESPVDARVLYACGFGTGVWKSTDGGKSWALKNTGIAGDQPFAWHIERDVKGVLYLVVARRSTGNDGVYGNELDGALYRSTDGAETWTRLTLPDGLNGPNGLAIDPRDPKRMYLAAWARYSEEGAVSGGIWLSTDAGESWKNIFTRDQFVYDVTIDPRNPDTLYACGFSSSAWRSSDAGATWQRIRGYNFKWGHRVIPDPYDPEMVFITTFGGSVWYGPAGGDPKALEDVADPVVPHGSVVHLAEEKSD